ncbi:MAG: stage II sporulation protein P [Clostridia bacterium]|nr:stage II sporulation protein P [Clostridia bacterium]
MKTERKKQIQRRLRRATTLFLMYALLPMICGGVVGLLLFLESFDIAAAEETFAKWSELGLSELSGAETRRSEKKLQLYFLSPELSATLPVSSRLSLGAAQYYKKPEKSAPQANDSPAPAPEKEDTTEQKEPSQVYAALPEDAVPVVSVDLSSPSYFINSTKYSVSEKDARKDPFPSETVPDGTKPLVLVLHTHGTEGYLEDDTNLSDFAPEGVETYFPKSTTSFRTTDENKSVVQVGRVFTETLNSLGIPTLHCTVMHDKEDFNDAYVNSAETVKRLLSEYPSIQYVIDLHRDSVVRGESYVKTKYQWEGEKSAQVMLVVGTNQNGRHPNWRQNLTVGVAWKDQMDALFPSLSRSVYLRTARFNQEYLPGCLLLEVGSCVNTLEEAECAARLAAEAFGAMLRANP